MQLSTNYILYIMGIAFACQVNGYIRKWIDSTHAMENYDYRRTGFKCEHVIIANCDFSPSAQLLERNVYITRIRTYVRV